MNSGIYKITNPKGEIYIGYSNNLKVRENNYRIGKAKGQTLLYDSIINYGFDKHVFEILEYCIISKCKSKEKHYIKFFNSFENGLNSNKGGGGVLFHSIESKNLISMKGKLNKGKRKESHWKGKSRGKDFSKKLSKAKKGKTNLLNQVQIIQCDINGKEIKQFKSIKEAAKHVEGNPTAISNALIKGGLAKSAGYTWKYKE
jgi:group I intron endonuclease